MIIVLLKFSQNKGDAPVHMDEHKVWLKQGIDQGVFLLAGSILPADGGAIMVNGLNLEETKHLIAQDPFVEYQVVTPEYIEISPSLTSDKMAFLTQNKEK